MLRVTLESDPGRKLCMPFGYEVTVPMSFGAITDPAQMVDFRGPRVAMQAERKEYWLNWDDDDMRSTLMEEAAAIHYFGNPQATSREDERVKRGQLPEFVYERQRVARVWGDYLYSDAHGHYATVRIRLPEVPHVMIVPVTQSGTAVPGAPIYRPHEFLRFEELLSPDWERELEMLRQRRPTFVAAPPPTSIDLANLSNEQIAALAAQLDRWSATQGKARGEEALRNHREEQKAKVGNGG
jgi:hypothetical protein